ncbi:hypothetical protein [Streptomyces roseus]|uniref:hypothetical protein n=1 Tax=Streptomyces roseus TaxID=66430 RepID=UPI00131AB2F2|nr:hypothetical protein [Streptomyces roseus]
MELEYEGLRQIAARGWTTPDGTRTRVYLLRFHAAASWTASTAAATTRGWQSQLVS